MIVFALIFVCLIVITMAIVSLTVLASRITAVAIAVVSLTIVAWNNYDEKSKRRGANKSIVTVLTTRNVFAARVIQNVYLVTFSVF